MIKKMGLIDRSGVVVNVIVVDTLRGFAPPAGLTLFDDESAEIGDTVVDGVLVKAVSDDVGAGVTEGE